MAWCLQTFTVAVSLPDSSFTFASGSGSFSSCEFSQFFTLQRVTDVPSLQSFSSSADPLPLSLSLPASLFFFSFLCRQLTQSNKLKKYCSHPSPLYTQQVMHKSPHTCEKADGYLCSVLPELHEELKYVEQEKCSEQYAALPQDQTLL